MWRDLESGEKIALDNWEIGEILGKGGDENGEFNKSSIVFKITRENPDLSIEVGALKFINLIEEQGKFDELSPDMQQEFIEYCNELYRDNFAEIKIMDILKDSPNIVSYNDYRKHMWKADDSYGFALLIRMNMYDDLNKQIKAGRIFSESEICDIGIDICKALNACHSQNILHRDIKPANIFINQRNEYMLGDFGISKIVQNTNIAKTSIGSLAYIAPEQAKVKSMESYDERVDIYSLGLVLYQLANNNKLPFSKSTYSRETEVIQRLKGERFDIPNNFDQELGNIILKACLYNKGERYQSAKQFLDALEDWKYKRESFYEKRKYFTIGNIRLRRRKIIFIARISFLFGVGSFLLSLLCRDYVEKNIKGDLLFRAFTSGKLQLPFSISFGVYSILFMFIFGELSYYGIHVIDNYIEKKWKYSFLAKIKKKKIYKTVSAELNELHEYVNKLIEKIEFWRK